MKTARPKKVITCKFCDTIDPCPSCIKKNAKKIINVHWHGDIPCNKNNCKNV